MRCGRWNTGPFTVADVRRCDRRGCTSSSFTVPSQRLSPPPTTNTNTPVKFMSSNTNIAHATTATLPYGLKRIDYSSLPPLTIQSKPLYSLPPPPPHAYNPKNSIFKSTIVPMVAPICIVIFIGSAIYIYLYPEDDVVEYWKQVEQGNVPVDNAYDDYDDDDDDDEDEWDDDE